MINWIKGYQDKHSNPVFKHCKNPDKWEVKDSRFIMFRYGKGGAIDICALSVANVLRQSPYKIVSLI